MKTIESHPTDSRWLQFSGTSESVASTMDGFIARRIRDTWNACIGLDLPDNVAPGTLSHAAKLLAKWHNWIASGQLAFKPEDLEESYTVLKPLGLPAMGPLDMAFGGRIGEDQAPVSPPPADLVTAARAALQACRTELEVRGADNDHVYAYPMAPVVRGLEEALDNPGPVSPPPAADSEPSNQDRAARAREILEAYARKNAPGDSLESNLGDLLADFRHLCAQGLEMDFEQANLMSEAHFAEESDAEPFDNAQAEMEGWLLVNQDEDPDIQRFDETRVFATDDDAIAFVRGKARDGSEYHSEALRLAGLPKDL